MDDIDIEVNRITSEELKESYGYKNRDELSFSKQKRLEKRAKKYKVHENLIIARVARKTIIYIEKVCVNFPNKESVLKSRIINACYDLLECIYRANVKQDIEDKKDAVVKIRMIDFYLEQALNKELISYKKYESFTKHLIEVDNMVRAWFKYNGKE